MSALAQISPQTAPATPQHATNSATKPNVRASVSDANTNYSAAHMQPGAFLKQPGPDVAHLVEQVRSNPDVAVRYSRLFHVPIKLVPAAFAQLHLATLREDQILHVHFVRKETVTQTDTVVERDPKTNKPVQRLRTHSVTRDSLVYKARRVKAGTKVYSLPDGTPLLIRVCGNPVRTRVTPQFYSRVSVPNFDPGETPEAILQQIAKPTDANLRTVTRSVEPPNNVPQSVITMVAAENVLPVEAIPVSPTLPPTELTQAALKPVYHWAHLSGLWGFGGAGAVSLLAFSGGGSSNSPITIGPSKAPPTFMKPTAPSKSGTSTGPAPTGSPGADPPSSSGKDPADPPIAYNDPPGPVPEPTNCDLAVALLVVSVSVAGIHTIRSKRFGL